MGEPEPGRFALDPPDPLAMQPRRSVALRGVVGRRHRRLTGLSGLLLFACMFLPAVKGCHQPVMPYEVPPFIPPYLYGLVLALIAMVHSPRSLALGALALRVIGSLVVIGSVVLMVIAPPIGIIELLIGAVLLVIVGLFETTEPRIVASGIVVRLLVGDARCAGRCVPVACQLAGPARRQPGVAARPDPTITDRHAGRRRGCAPPAVISSADEGSACHCGCGRLLGGRL
jgi:hypothetical protein